MINGHAMIENIIEHAAAVLGMTPLELKLKNMMSLGDPVMPPNNFLGILHQSKLIIFIIFFFS